MTIELLSDDDARGEVVYALPASGADRTAAAGETLVKLAMRQ
jgi:hypothetical protein